MSRILLLAGIGFGAYYYLNSKSSKKNVPVILKQDVALQLEPDTHGDYIVPLPLVKMYNLPSTIHEGIVMMPHPFFSVPSTRWSLGLDNPLI